MEGERIVSPTTPRYGLREGVKGGGMGVSIKSSVGQANEEKSVDDNHISFDDEEFSRKWSFQSSSQDPGSPEHISSVHSSNTLDYSIEQNDTFDELLHKISSKGGGNKSNIFMFDNNNNNSNSNAVGTNNGYSINNNSTSHIIHDATSPPPSHRPEYGTKNLHGSGSASVPLVTPPGLTNKTKDCCSAQKNQQPATTGSTPAQKIDEVDDDGTFVGRNGGGGCGVCLGLTETVDTTLSSMTDLFMDYIGGGNNYTTIIDSACTKWKNDVVPGGVATGFQYYETASQKQARVRTEKQYAWARCFED